MYEERKGIDFARDKYNYAKTQGDSNAEAYKFASYCIDYSSNTKVLSLFELRDALQELNRISENGGI